jgi:hypothetical protein
LRLAAFFCLELLRVAELPNNKITVEAIDAVSNENRALNRCVYLSPQPLKKLTDKSSASVL